MSRKHYTSRSDPLKSCHTQRNYVITPCRLDCKVAFPCAAKLGIWEAAFFYLFQFRILNNWKFFIIYQLCSIADHKETNQFPQSI